MQLEVLKGKESFFWAGRYHYDMNTRDTLETRLNVLLDLDPKLPEAYRTAPYVMLGNLDPGEMPKQLQSMGISSRRGGFMALLSSHPPTQLILQVK